MYDEAVIESAARDALQQVNAAYHSEQSLSGQKLATLRHDLRTPFNQIIGYASMLGEDAADGEDQTVPPAADLVVTAAYAVLERFDLALLRDASDVTPQSLTMLRAEAAPSMGVLLRSIEELEKLANARDPRSEETVLNLARLQTASSDLQTLFAATAYWHDEDPKGLDMRQPRALTATSTTQQTQNDLAEHAAFTAVFDRRTIESDAPAESAEAHATEGRTVLIVDDQPSNRDLLQQQLRREGMQTRVASSGAEALTLLQTVAVDLVLLDVLMPGMDGVEVLQHIKASDALRHIPVIMISALNEIEKVVQCIESGAEDYLPKPFNPVLLRARIGVTLERKRLREEEERQRREMSQALAALAIEREKAHELLLNILPASVAKDLQQGHSAPMYFEDTTICFTDFVGFTLSTESMAAEHVVEELHTYFTAFDRVMERYGLEKLKTIGDSYMFASGLPNRHPAHPVNALLAALELLEETKRLSERPHAPNWQIRIGLHTGPVIAGVVGIRKFAFDIWGDSVNFASRMESSGAAGRINVSERTYTRTKDFLECEHRGRVMTKDKREVEMFFVNGIQPALVADGTPAAFERRYKLYFGQHPPSFPHSLLKRS